MLCFPSLLHTRLLQNVPLNFVGFQAFQPSAVTLSLMFLLVNPPRDCGDSRNSAKQENGQGVERWHGRNAISTRPFMTNCIARHGSD